MNRGQDRLVASEQNAPFFTVRTLDDIADLVVALGIEVQLKEAIWQRAQDARGSIERLEQRGLQDQRFLSETPALAAG